MFYDHHLGIPRLATPPIPVWLTQSSCFLFFTPLALKLLKRRVLERDLLAVGVREVGCGSVIKAERPLLLSHAEP